MNGHALHTLCDSLGYTLISTEGHVEGNNFEYKIKVGKMINGIFVTGEFTYKNGEITPTKQINPLLLEGIK